MFSGATQLAKVQFWVWDNPKQSNLCLEKSTIYKLPESESAEFGVVAQSVVRRADNAKVPGSIPGNTNFLNFIFLFFLNILFYNRTFMSLSFSV